MFELTGKVVIITGGCGLLGRQHADAVARFGGNPVILDLDAQKSEALALQIAERYQVQALGLAMNLTQESEIAACCQQVVDRFGKVDVLINNAANNPQVNANSGLENPSRLENFSLETWNQDMAVGLTGAFLCAKYFGHAISQNPNGGSIINVSSDLGVMAPDQRLYAQEGLKPEQQNVKPVTYSVVKTGLIGLTRYLATYWCEQNVRSNAICPGGVFNQQGEAFVQKVSSLIPLGRMAKVDEYQGAIVFLASEASSYMNGAVLVMDGGRSTW